jgi:hypothetical protein
VESKQEIRVSFSSKTFLRNIFKFKIIILRTIQRGILEICWRDVEDMWDICWRYVGDVQKMPKILYIIVRYFCVILTKNFFLEKF